MKKEKRENEETGYCDFELKNMLLAFFCQKTATKKTDSTSLKMHLFRGLYS